MIATRRGFLLTAGAAGAGLLGGCGRAAGPGRGSTPARGAARISPHAGREVDLAGHVLSRCTFGIAPGDREELLGLAGTPRAAVEAWVARQIEPESIDDGRARRALRRFAATPAPLPELYEMKERVLLREMVSAAVLSAVLTRRQLAEVMVHFWTDHFNIDVSRGDCAWLKAADDREVIRRHALGRFRDLLGASARSPAMLWYLDGRVNSWSGPEDRPNENYARELLELHTMGVHGGYTQHDVAEVARCLTGWSVRPRSGFGKGRVAFDPSRHDDGPKRVLGREIPAGLGAGDLDRVLDLVAGHPATARLIAFKLCRRFIADEPPQSAVEPVARAFAESGGDIRRTLAVLLARPELLAEDAPHRAHRGAKVKRPFHFLVSALRATGARTDAGPALTAYLDSMGHAPFQYPTPDGYPEEAGPWTSTLLWRFKLASALVTGAIDGTRLDTASLIEAAGSEGAMASHLLGRAAHAVEWDAFRAAGGGATGVALLLASPAFQRY